MINFVPNDPRARNPAPQMRTQAPRPNRPASRSGFTFTGATPQGTFNPGTPQFLFWQCREAALAALEAWEASAGKHTAWQGNRKKLFLIQNQGQDLNAFYNRQSFSFFQQAVGNAVFESGASTDVVAHEIGHGLMDSVRPDFFDVNFLEVGAFHEAFGDILAILTALNDRDTRVALLGTAANLRARNFVETTAEDLSEGIRRLQPTHNAAAPRRAFNAFKFQIPDSLPTNGGPGALIREVHSFGMVFTGCFWDLLANLFGAANAQNEASLLATAQLAGKITIAGAQTAVVTPRFLQSVGRAMVLADETMNAAANREHIRDAFLRHSILLGTNTMIAPSMALAGAAPKGASLRPETRKDLVARLRADPGTRFHVSSASLFGTPVVSAVHTREVALSPVDNRLKGVVARAPEPVMVGAQGAFAAVVGSLPNPSDTETEVHSFVKSLVDHERIDLGKVAKGGKKKVKEKKNKTGNEAEARFTHAVRTVGGKRVLVRVGFSCCAESSSSHG